MAERATLARPYANAVFDLAQEAGELDLWSRQLAFLAIATTDITVSALIDTPSVSDEQKAFRLQELVRDVSTSLVANFIQVLAENKRLPLLPEISKQFEALKAEAEKVLDVEITSTVVLTDEELSSFTRALEQRFDRNINVSTAIDETLIGGAVIRAGDTVVDGSVRGKLGKLAEALSRI
jgi:F-type H+-transporting ATPase subunit delta